MTYPDVDRWLADARADEAIAARARQRWLHQQQMESATLAGTLLDLAEAGIDVLLTTVAGTRHRTRIRAVAPDFVVTGEDRSPDRAFVALSAITSIQPLAPVGEATGDRAAAADVLLVEALATAAADRPDVAAVTTSGERFRGQLRAAANDVVSLHTENRDHPTVYLAVPSLAEIWLV